MNNETEIRNEQLTAIAEALGPDWRVFDHRNIRNQLAAHGLCSDDGRSVWCHFDPEYFEFSPYDHPTYCREDGTVVKVWCRELYSPKQDEPHTRARRDRDPKQIANQIRNKLLLPWAPIRERLQNIADARDSWARDKLALRAKVAEVSGATGLRDVFYPYKGTTRVEITGSDTVDFKHVPAELALKILKLIKNSTDES
jgi:hypothetical protein